MFIFRHYELLLCLGARGRIYGDCLIRNQRWGRQHLPSRTSLHGSLRVTPQLPARDPSRPREGPSAAQGLARKRLAATRVCNSVNRTGLGVSDSSASWHLKAVCPVAEDAGAGTREDLVRPSRAGAAAAWRMRRRQRQRQVGEKGTWE